MDRCPKNSWSAVHMPDTLSSELWSKQSNIYHLDLYTVLKSLSLNVVRYLNAIANCHLTLDFHLTICPYFNQPNNTVLKIAVSLDLIVIWFDPTAFGVGGYPINSLLDCSKLNVLSMFLLQMVLMMFLKTMSCL